jgi:hypothetical protein
VLAEVNQEMIIVFLLSRVLHIFTCVFETEGNLHYDLPVTLKGGKKEKQDRPE